MIAGTLGDVLLWNRKAESCFYVFLWKCLFLCHLLALSPWHVLHVFAWLDYPDQFVLYALPSVQSCTWRWWDPERNSSSPLRIEASQCSGRRLQIAFLHKCSLLWWKYEFVIPLSKRAPVCVLNAEAPEEPARFRVWIISQAALCVSLQCGFPLREALKPWIFSLACTCCQKLVGDTFLFNAEKRTSFYCKYFIIFYGFYGGNCVISRRILGSVMYS